MAVIQVQIGKEFFEDVILYVGFGVNIITEKLCVQLGLLKPKSTPYNLHMANQIIVQPLGLIKNLKFFVHGIPYMIRFTIVHNSVLNSSYFMHYYKTCP